MLNVLDRVPAGLLERDATRLYEILPGPTLIHLEGRRTAPLYVSVLLHGNEDTGWETVRALLAEYADRPLPRSMSIFIGNVAAARYRRRHLEQQPDFNRVWRGKGTAEHRMMAEVVDTMGRRGVFASVDIHNNSGRNPHYACVNKLSPPFLQLASLFSRTVVYFTTPDTVQSRAFAPLCPAVTLEAGQPGQAHGVEHALEYLHGCLSLVSLPEHAVASGDIDLFHTVGVIKVSSSFSFSTGDADIRLVSDLDQLNFRELPQGTCLGWVTPGSNVRLEVWDEAGREVGDRYFCLRGGELVTKARIIPSMFTLDDTIIREDCLGYIMERYPLDWLEPRREN